MGGCLLNSVAISAFYALKKLSGKGKVGILDIDAHHGNGIAHCVQDEERIRYASIHEFREVTIFQKVSETIEKNAHMRTRTQVQRTHPRTHTHPRNMNPLANTGRR